MNVTPTVSILPEPISDAEIAERVGRLQEQLRDQGLGAVICFGAHRDYAPADIRYLARWSCTDEELSFVFVPAEGESVLVTDAPWDVERAQSEASAGRIVFDADPASTLARLVRVHVGTTGHVGISGFAVFPTPIYITLQNGCPGVVFTDVSSVVTALRRVKSPSEVALLRAAARLTDLGMAAGIAEVREGGSEFDVVAAAEHAIRAHGGELAFSTVMGAGPRTSQATFFAGSRPMQRGDFAVLDCGGRVHGYHGDMCRTVVVGNPDARQRDMLEVVAASVGAATSAARPGARVADVTAAAAQVVSDAGLGEYWWGYYMPHGTGTGQHEPPDPQVDGELRLEPGMVMCIEPGIAVPGVCAVILEQMVHVTDGEAETLNELPLALWDP
jgi:Xaa-Pro aminopeptidase